jgi:uncharacterized protein (TIGR03663 family)
MTLTLEGGDKRREGHSFGAATGELGVWVLIGLVALAMRVAQLDAAPFDAHEASAGMRAWRAATGQSLPAADYNPVLLVGNSLLFVLMGASDTAARLWPALFGAVLAVSPVLLRRRLGRIGALAAAVFLTLSPTALVASRQLRGTVVAAAGVMVFLGGLVRFLETERARWVTLSAIGLALGLGSGASAYGLLVPLAGAWLSLTLLGPDEDRSNLGYHVSGLKSHAPQFALVFSAALVALATGLGWNLAGLGAVGGLFGEWLERFGPGVGPAASLLTLLVVYESLALVLGVAGLAWGVMREDRLATLLGLWVALAVALLTVMPGRSPTDLLWLVLPLALLAGRAVEEVMGDRWVGTSALHLIYGTIILVLWAYFYLMLAHYAAFGDRTDLVLALIAVVLQAVLGVSFGLVLGGERTVRMALGATGVALLTMTVSAGWGAAYRRPTDPREALTSRATAVNVRDLIDTLRALSWEETGMPHTLRFTFEADEDSVLAWYLRDFDMGRRVDELEDADLEDLGHVVVTQGHDAALLTSGDEMTYAGQDFPLWREWSPREIGCRFWQQGCNRAIDWLLFREGVPLPEPGEWVTLWRRGALSHSAEGDG